MHWNLRNRQWFILHISKQSTNNHERIQNNREFKPLSNSNTNNEFQEPLINLTNHRGAAHNKGHQRRVNRRILNRNHNRQLSVRPTISLNNLHELPNTIDHWHNIRNHPFNLPKPLFSCPNNLPKTIRPYRSNKSVWGSRDNRTVKYKPRNEFSLRKLCVHNPRP